MNTQALAEQLENHFNGNIQHIIEFIIDEDTELFQTTKDLLNHTQKMENYKDCDATESDLY